MKKIIFIAILIFVCALIYFEVSKRNMTSNNIEDANKTASIILDQDASKGENMSNYKSISIEEAKTIFTLPGDYIILDVRRDDEFSQGHIPGAINVANEDISTKIVPELPDLNQTIYVYCRSGRRSKEAAQKLTNIGYTNIIEFGGIIDWTGEIE